MKNIFVVQNSSLGSPLPLSIYLTGLLKHYKKDKNFHLNLISAKSVNDIFQINKNFDKVYEIKSNTYSIKDNLKFSWQTFKIITKENKILKIDLIHCLYPNSSLLGAVIFKIFINCRVKILYDVRSPWIEMSIFRGHINKWVAFLCRLILYPQEILLCKFVNYFMFISDGLKKYYINTFKIKSSIYNTYVSPSGVDLSMFKKIPSDIRKIYKVKDDEILIGSVGFVDKTRRLDQFLFLFKSLVDNNLKVKLMFIGKGGDIENLKNLVNKESIDDKVIFVDTVPHKEIPKYISSFNFGLCHIPDVFVFKSSFALKILEYLALEVPVLASNMPANKEISKKLKFIYLYQNSPISFVKIFKDACKKVDMQKSLKQNLNDYDWKNIKNKYYEIYSKA